MKNEIIFYLGGVAEEEEYEHRREENIKLKEIEYEFIESLDKSSLGKIIEENAEQELRECAAEMNFLTKSVERYKKELGIIDLLVEQLNEKKKKYKKLYLRLGMVKNTYGGIKTKDNRLSSYEMDCIRNIPIDNLLPGGVQLLNAGNGRKKCSCPFHKEKTPSFVIFSNNSFYCFGCNKGGANAIDYVMVRDDCSFVEALKKLKR